MACATPPGGWEPKPETREVGNLCGGVTRGPSFLETSCPRPCQTKARVPQVLRLEQVVCPRRRRRRELGPCDNDVINVIIFNMLLTGGHSNTLIYLLYSVITIILLTKVLLNVRPIIITAKVLLGPQ